MPILHVLDILLARLHESVRRAVSDIHGVGNGGILCEHEVDIGVRRIDILRTARNAHRIHKEVRALLGGEEGEGIV